MDILPQTKKGLRHCCCIPFAQYLCSLPQIGNLDWPSLVGFGSTSGVGLKTTSCSSRRSSSRANASELEIGRPLLLAC